MKINLKFDIHDLWIGVYWKHESKKAFFNCYHVTSIFICILPAVPISVTWRRIEPL